MKRLIPFLLILLILPSLASAADYYVSPSGSASWSQCMNINIPCSLATANANAHAGDNVYLLGGTYENGLIYPSRSGTPGDRIVYAAYTGEIPVLDGNNALERCIDLRDSDYITIDGITARDPSGYYIAWLFGNSKMVHGNILQNLTLLNAGISATKNDGLQILNCRITSPKHVGIFLYGSAADAITNTRIEGCTVTNAGSLTGQADGITIHEDDADFSSVGPYHILKGNVVSGSTENNYDITSGSYIVLDGNVGYCHW